MNQWTPYEEKPISQSNHRTSCLKSKQVDASRVAHLDHVKCNGLMRGGRVGRGYWREDEVVFMMMMMMMMMILMILMTRRRRRGAQTIQGYSWVFHVAHDETVWQLRQDIWAIKQNCKSVNHIIFLLIWDTSSAPVLLQHTHIKVTAQSKWPLTLLPFSKWRLVFKTIGSALFSMVQRCPNLRIKLALLWC